MQGSSGMSGRNFAVNSINNRINIMFAVIFLLVVALLFKLYILQINGHDRYLNSAINQHYVSAEIAPERGKIFIQDSRTQSLYPLATNKDYIIIYAEPRNLEHEEALAKIFYEFFKKDLVEEEVDKALDNQAADRLERQLSRIKAVEGDHVSQMMADIKEAHKDFLATADYREARDLKRQEMIKASREAILKEYELSFTNKEDAYEQLQKKVELDKAKAFHLALLKEIGRPADYSADDFEFSLYNIKLTDNRAGDVLVSGVGYVKQKFRYYLEGSVASHLLGYVRVDPNEKNDLNGLHGYYGLEGFFDQELFGVYGQVVSEKGAGGLIIANNRQVKNRQNGADLVLTIDREVQFYTSKIIKQYVDKYRADSGTIVVMRPDDGALIAMASYPNFDPNNYFEVEDFTVFNNPALFGQYEPGSVFKAITMAAALNEGGVNPKTLYEDKGQIMAEGWPKPIKNSDFETHGPHGMTDMITVLEQSLNTGAIFAMESIGAEKFAEYVKDFGFGERTGIELEGEAKGDIRSLTGDKVKQVSAYTASFGQGITATPLQLVTAYSAIANGGKKVKPYVVKEIRYPDKEAETTEMIDHGRLISESTATTLSAMLVNVVENGHGKGVQVPGYYVAGKTGTAQIASQEKKGYSDRYNHTFIAFAPAEKPAFVVLVKLENPQGYDYSSETAVPVAKNIIEFILKQWQIPQDKALNE